MARDLTWDSVLRYLILPVTGGMLLESIEHVNIDLDTATSTIRDEMLRQQEEGLDAGRMWKTWIDIFKGLFDVTDQIGSDATILP